jgi:prolipoprotein diacylglyceryl transferase
MRVGPVTLYPYPTMLFVGIVCGVITATVVAEGRGLPADRVYVGLIALVAPAVVGARLLFVACHWRTYRHDLGRVFRRSDSGAALFGGFVLALVVSVPLLRMLRLPFAEFWDMGAVVLMVGMACTKVGCHLNGCCAGRPTAGLLGMRLRNARGVVARRVPAQLLEGALAAALLAITLPLSARLGFGGALVLTASLGYGVGRYALEGIREDPMRVSGVRVSRAIAASLAVVAALLLTVGLARHDPAVGTHTTDAGR